MNIIRCKNGHWYDADSYSSCPHCESNAGGAVARVERKESKADTGKKNWLKKTRPRKEKSTTKTESLSNAPSFDDVFMEIDADTDAVTDTDVIERNDSNRKIGFITTERELSEEPYTKEADPDATQGAYNSQPSFIGHSRPTPAVAPAKPRFAEENDQDQSSSLMKAVNRVSKVDMDKTVGFFKSMTNNNLEDVSSFSTVQNPVVGWLVCVEGPHWGESFSVVTGKNSIGRNDENQISLSKDKSVSGKAHAWITYEESHRNFLLDHGDGRYPDLNGAQVLSPTMIQSFDKIKLGKTTLLFINLCGENFSWEDYLKED